MYLFVIVTKRKLYFLKSVLTTYLNTAVQVSFSGRSLFSFHKAQNCGSCSWKEQKEWGFWKQKHEAKPFSNITFLLLLPFPFFWEPGVSFTLCLQMERKSGMSLCMGLVTGWSATQRDENWYALVVGEGGVRGADGHSKQQHIFGVGLSCQRGEQVLCLLTTQSTTGVDQPQGPLKLQNHTHLETRVLPSRHAQDNAYLCSGVVLVGFIVLKSQSNTELLKTKLHLQTKQHISKRSAHLLFLLSSSALFCSLLSVGTFSRLLWLLCCSLRGTWFLGGFLRRRPLDRLVLPLSFLAFLPLVLLLLGGAGRLERAESHLESFARSRPVSIWWCSSPPHPEQLHHQLSVLFVLVLVLFLDLL